MVTHSRFLEGSPDEVLAAFNDPELAADWATELKATRHEWRTDGSSPPRTELTFSSDLSRVPAPFSRYVGPTLDVRDRRAWQAAGEGAGYMTELDVSALTGGKGGVLAGTLVVAPEGSGSRVSMEGDVSLVGISRLLARTLRTQVETLVVNVLIDQLDLVARRLTPPPLAG